MSYSVLLQEITKVHPFIHLFTVVSQGHVQLVNILDEFCLFRLEFQAQKMQHSCPLHLLNEINQQFFIGNKQLEQNRTFVYENQKDTTTVS